MIVCDICNKSIDMNTPEIVNTVKLGWTNLVSNPPITAKAYHLCEKCSKELNKHIESIAQKKEKTTTP